MPDYTVCTGTYQLVSNNASLQTGWQWSSNGGVIADPTSANTSITFSQAGIYTLQLAVGSELGTTITTQTVTVSNAPSLSITASSEILCGGGSTNLTANFSNGSVQWSSGQTVTTIIVSPSTTTTYVATLTANNGCIATATQVVEVVTQANIQITASDNSICAGESVTLTASGGEFYAWSNGSSSTSITVSPSSTTTYTVSGIVGSCNGSDSQLIQVSSAPNITIQSPSTTVCNGNSITLTANGGSSYLWSTGQTTASITVSPTANTTYTVTGTNSGGCQNTASRNITIGATPNVNVVASNMTPCPGTTITVTAVGATTYVWATGQTTNAITVTPLVNTTYYATGTNAAGCSATDSLVINLDPVPAITITNASNSICAGSSVTLTANGGNSYAWNGGQTTAAITVTPANSTTYTVTGTNSFNCSATASRTITVNPIPNVDIESSSPAVCLGGSIDLSGTGAATYSWNTGATTAVITVSPTAATTYTVTGTTAAGCSSQASRLVNVQAAPQIVFSEFPAGFCLNSSSFQLDASPLGGIFSGPGISGDLFIPANAGEGTHVITYLLDDGVCAVDSSFELLVEECVSVDALSSVEEVNIYPNPASDWLYVDGLKNEVEVSILNLQGQIVGRIKFQDSATKINIGNYASGVYFLQWQSEEGMQSRKFIVEH
jgi:predicted transcriptional regulator